MQIKSLAEILGVTPDTVINWELRGMKPKMQATKTRVDDYLSKPIKATDLYDMIERWGKKIRHVAERRSSFCS